MKSASVIFSIVAFSALSWSVVHEPVVEEKAFLSTTGFNESHVNVKETSSSGLDAVRISDGDAIANVTINNETVGENTTATIETDAASSTLKNASKQIEPFLGVPIGAVLAWTLPDPGLSVEEQLPEGFRLCFGPDPADDPETPLFDETRIPDLRDRFIMGVNEAALGAQGGTSTRTTNDHNHGGNTGYNNDAIIVWWQSYARYAAKQKNHRHTISTNSHNHEGDNQPPYYSVLMIIRTSSQSSSEGATSVDGAKAAAARFDMPVGSMVAWIPPQAGVPVCEQTPPGFICVSGECDDEGDNPSQLPAPSRIPDLQNRFLMGADDSSLENYGGRADVPAGGGHNHGGNTGWSGSNMEWPSQSNSNPAHDDHRHTIATEANHNHGGENRPPYVGLIILMRVSDGEDPSPSKRQDTPAVKILHKDLHQEAVCQAPVGSIISWIPPIPVDQEDIRLQLPTGYLVCDEPRLENDAATLYDETRIPDLRNRFLKGVENKSEVGITGGRADIPTEPNHNHSAGSVFHDWVYLTPGGDAYPCHMDSHSHSIPADGAHNHGGENRPPFFGVIMLMKVGGYPGAYEADFNNNGTPDASEDFNNNGTPDASEDFNGNGKADAFEMDFNGNGIPDVFEYSWLDGVFTDYDEDGTPDALEDNNGNDIPDAFEDFNENLIADAFEDFNENHIPDAFENFMGSSTPDAFEMDFNGNSIPDVFEYAHLEGVFVDFNNNGMPDALEDYDDNDIPDAFELNFNGNAIPDVFEFGWLAGVFTDFNQNGTPDALEDRNGNDVPEAFEVDFDHDGIPDAFEDYNGNGIPDTFEDFNANDRPDVFEYFNAERMTYAFTVTGWPGDSIPEFFRDFDGNGRPDGLEDRNNNGIPDGLEDFDRNGIADLFEDRDGDGIADGLALVPGLDRPPAFADVDFNGISDLLEKPKIPELLWYDQSDAALTLLGRACPSFSLSRLSPIGTLDLAGNEDHSMASANYWFGTSIMERSADPFAESPQFQKNPLIMAQPSPARVDATSEPGGYVLAGRDGEVRFFNKKQLGSMGNWSLEGNDNEIIDVAGLAYGRAALLLNTDDGSYGRKILLLNRPLLPSGLYGQPSLGGDPSQVLNIPMYECEPGMLCEEQGIALAGLKYGGFALLTDQNVYVIDDTYPADTTQWKQFPLTGANEAASSKLEDPLDVVVDEEDNILVLFSSPGRQGVQAGSSVSLPLAINDNSQTVCSIQVGKKLTIADVNLMIGITHTYVGDLTITLQSPAGTVVNLFNRVCNPSSGDNFSNTTFDDAATQSIQTSAPPFKGSFLPNMPLAAFNGQNAEGTWTLTVSDNAGGDIGTLDVVALIIDAEDDENTLDARTVMCLNDYGVAHLWTPFDVWRDMSESASNTAYNTSGASAIAAFMSPEGLTPVGDNPIPWEPELPEPEPGQTREEIGDSGIAVDASEFQNDGTWTWPEAGEISLLNFLKIDVDGPNLAGDYLRWATNEPSMMEGRGNLRLDFSDIPGFDELFPNGLSLLNGEFRINLITGELEKVSGSWGIELPFLGQIDFSRIQLLGMGDDYENTSPQSGIVFENGTSEFGIGDLGLLGFDRLFLGDFGGKFQMTFGMPGLPGLMPPYTEGGLTFIDTPFIRLKTTGEKFSDSQLHFDSLILQMLGNASAPLFDLQLLDLNIKLDNVSFGESVMKIAEVMTLTVKSGSIGNNAKGPGWKSHTGAGVYAENASLEFPGAAEPMMVAHLYIGQGGIEFDNEVSFNLAGFQSTLTNVGFESPFNASGSFTMDRAEFTVAGMTAHLTGVRIPLSGMPTATGGSIALGNTPENATVRLVLDGALTFSANEIAIPHIEFLASGFNLSFSGGRISRNMIEIYDAPAVSILGVDMDLAQSSFGNGLFSTSEAYVGMDGIAATLRDLRIGSGGLHISGGGFDWYGFGVDIRSKDVANELCLGADVKGIPYFGQAGLDFCLPDGGGFEVTGVRLPNLQLGPVSVKNAKIASEDDWLAFTANVGISSWMFDGAVELQNGKLKKIGVTADWTNMAPSGGYQLWTTPPIYLNSVGVVLYPAELRMEGTAVICLLGAYQIPLIGKCTLLGCNGKVEISGAGYVRTDVDVQAFAQWNDTQNIWDGIELSRSTAIAGNVFLNGSFRGLGFYGAGNLDFFGFISGRAEAWAYWKQPCGLIMDGTVQMPKWVPIIGGTSFGGTKMRHIINPFAGDLIGSLQGEVWFKLCFPPIYYPCGVEWCESCVGKKWWRVCASYPCGVRICEKRYCQNLRFGVKIDDNGIHANKDKQGLLKFGDGYACGDGLTVLTNYNLLEEKTLDKDGEMSKYADTAGIRVIPFEYSPETKEERNITQKTREAIFRYDFTSLPGDANINLRFPDGRLYRWNEVPRFSPDQDMGKQALAGDITIAYQHNIYDDGEHQVKEAAFVCKGPFGFEDVEILNDEGQPTGKTQKVFGPGPLPYGRYEIIVESTGKADLGKLNVLGGNNLAELIYARLEPLDQEDTYKVSWKVTDPDGDEVVVRVHLVPDLNIPENGILIGDENGYVSNTGVGDFSFDMLDPDITEIHSTSPLHVMISLEDRSSKEDAPDTRQYFNVGIVRMPEDPSIPPSVEGVVGVAQDGSAELYWESSKWTPKKDGQQLVAYSVICEEIGPEGTTTPPITVTVPAVNIVQPVDENGLPNGEPSINPTDLEGLIPGLINGRRYRVTIVPIVQETTISKDGETSVQQTAGMSSDAVVLLPMGAANNPPSFISEPLTIARMDTQYRYRVRVQDLDSDPVNLTIDLIAPIKDPDAKLDKADVLFEGLELVPTENTYEWDLTFIPRMAKATEIVGQWLFKLVAAEDRPDGESATQEYVVSVAQVYNKSYDAFIDSQPDLSVYAGDTFSYQIVVAGLPDDLPIGFALNDAPEGMQIDPVTGLVTWATTMQDIGSYQVSVIVREGSGIGVDDPSSGGCPTCSSAIGGSGLARQEFTLSVISNPLVAYAPVISLTPGTQTIRPEGDDATIGVTNIGTGTLSWNAVVVEGVDWLQISSADLSTIGLTVTANTATSTRTGIVRVSAIDGSCTPVDAEIIQQGAAAVQITASPIRLDFPVDGGVASIDVVCIDEPCKWSASIVLGDEWIGIAEGTSGNDNGIIQVVCDINNVYAARTGTLQIISNIGGSINIPISQAAVPAPPEPHSADADKNWIISATEISRVVGFYNAGTYHMDGKTTDGFAPGSGVQYGKTHDSDYSPKDWQISAVELSRLVTFYNAGSYIADSATLDGFSPEF